MVKRYWFFIDGEWQELSYDDYWFYRARQASSRNLAWTSDDDMGEDWSER